MWHIPLDALGPKRVQSSLGERRNALPRRSNRNLSDDTPKTPEVKLETLQALSFELIGKSVTLWRTYKEDDKSKGIKIERAYRIHQMVIDAIRFHPDIQHLRELDKYREEAEQIIANARKVFEANPRRQRT
jgi:hypothetical protein